MTDRRTDGQTDRQNYDCKYFASIAASRGKKNWLQFFVVKATALKQQISKFYPQIQRTEASCHIDISQQSVINAKCSICTQNLRTKF